MDSEILAPRLIMDSEILAPRLIKERLWLIENRLCFPGEIWNFQIKNQPTSIIVAKVSSSFERWVGGAHSDWLAGPDNPHGWKSFGDAVAKIVSKSLDMREKHLFHELPFGGVKFAIFSEVPLVTDARSEAYLLLGEAVSHFNGKIFAAADVNTSTDDLMLTFCVSPHVLGLEPKYGGSGDPSLWTARGVFSVIQEYFRIFHGADTLAGKRINLKGIGKVGWPLMELLYKDGVNLGVADIDPQKVEEARRRLRGVEKVSEKDIHCLWGHVFSPCDKEITITAQNVQELGSKAIIGAANDQCRDMALEEVLFQKGIFHLSMNGCAENGGGINAVVSPLMGGRKWLDGAMAKLAGKAGEIMQESKETKTPAPKIVKALIEKRARETGNLL